MRLFEAIVDANHRALAGDKNAGLHPDDFAEALPIVALTCIDPRLNRLFPAVLGVPEEKFIWLRNAGNIIFDSMSSMTRTLALACVVKGGREIALIGHTDCRVGKFSMVELTDRFKTLGIDRAKLPENLNDFFGLFASERQNVMRGVEFVRNSPLIGPKIPVHGLLVDVESGKLEWLVNGYQTLAAVTTTPIAAIRETAPGLAPLSTLPEFKIGEMKFPESKIGDMASPGVAAARVEVQQPATVAPETSTPIRVAVTAAKEPTPATPPPVVNIDLSALFKVLGDDKKIYGPVSGRDILQWLSEGRIDTATLIQKTGYKEWKPLAHFIETHAPKIPLPPAIADFLTKQTGRKR